MRWVSTGPPDNTSIRPVDAVFSPQQAPGAGIGSTAAVPLLTEVGALGYLGVWWAGQHEVTAAEREYRLESLKMGEPSAVVCVAHR